MQGTGGATWGDDQVAAYRPYDLHIQDSSRPFTAWTDRKHDVIRLVGVEVPKSLLPLPPGAAERVIGRPMSGQDGIGAFLTRFLLQITTGTPTTSLPTVPDSGLY